MHLKENYEIYGILDSIEVTKYKLKLKFKVMKLIELPLPAIPIEKLQKMQGQKVSILCLNDKYWLRKISE